MLNKGKKGEDEGGIRVKVHRANEETSITRRGEESALGLKATENGSVTGNR